MKNSILALPSWSQIDFISDIHLSEQHPDTYFIWLQYLQNNKADAIFILGDLFEAWVGDDAILETGFERNCALALAQCSLQKPIFMLHGNRDFLTKQAFFDFTGIQQLDDPCKLSAFGDHYLLSHGDALCTSDTDYMQLRSVVRSPIWQTAVLAQPLATRRQMADKIKADKLSTTTEPSKDSNFYNNLDINHNLAIDWLNQHGSNCLIHGHTHKPQEDSLNLEMSRWVLSDWEVDHPIPRAEVLSLTKQGLSRISLIEPQNK